MQDNYETWIARFNPQPIDLDGERYGLSHKELAPLHRYKTNYWHPNGPSTWMTVATFNLARRKYPDLTEKGHLRLTAHVLRVDWKEVVRLIRWHEQYMTFHDGAAYQVLQDVYE